MSGTEKRLGIGDPCPGCDEPIAAGDLLGQVDPDIYDGVVTWRHKCGHRWARFPKGDRRHVEIEATR